MNSLHSLPRCLAACAKQAALIITLATAGLQAQGQSWETILQLDSPLQGARHSSRAILVDPASSDAAWPDLLVAGQVNGDSDKLHRLIQDADPAEGLLVPLDDGIGTIYAMASDPSGQFIYTAGEVATGSSTTAWVVRRSLDHGLSWISSTPFSLGGSVAQARGITVTQDGTIVVCGFALDAANYSHWVVGTSADGGATWSYTKVFSSSATADLTVGQNLVQAFGVAQTADGSLWVVGSRGSRSAGRWTVTRSFDGGKTWITNVDSWLPSGKNASSRARKIATDAAGRIFVLGDTGYGTEMDASPWVVRMSSDGGASWNTIFGPWSYSAYDVNPLPLDMTVDGLGRVWLAGGALERVPVSQSKGKVVYSYLRTALAVRLDQPLNPLTVPWHHSVSAVSPVCEFPAIASSITRDDYGQIYVSGRYRDNTTAYQWFVKRLQQP
jgi:hypothetical protein